MTKEKRQDAKSGLAIVATGAKGAQYSFDRAMLVAPAIAGSR